MTGRPQDQGRRHRARAAGSERSQPLLADWYDALRRELRAVVDELAPAPTGQTRLDGAPDVAGPGAVRRRELVELGSKIVAALGTEVDPPAPPERPVTPRGAPRVGARDL